MIIIRLAGGFGNQLFQFGAGLLLAQKSGIKKVLIDDSALNNYDAKRQNELFNFINLKEISLNVRFKHLNITKFRLPKLLSLNISKFPLVSDKNFQKILKNPNKKFLLLDGYFQESLTQENFDTEIKILKKIFIRRDLEKKDGCIVHIRGGDFVKLGWDSVASVEYYLNAIGIMQAKYEQIKFYVISDDREYALTILDKLNINFEFIGSNMYNDFYLIGHFKHRILSASTFALFASALGNNRESLVIAPKYWSPNCKRNIVLPNEIRI